MTLLSLLSVIVLAVAHLFGHRLYTTGMLPRGQFLSAAAGFAVAFVFLHLLPDLGAWQHAFEQEGHVDVLNHHLYLVALIGLIVFFGVEWLLWQGRASRDEEHVIFRAHLLIFALYNILIGYLMIYYDFSGQDMLTFTLAIGLHFIGNDHALREHHQKRYHDRGRWLLTGAIIFGWMISMIVDVGETAVAIFFAFLAGSLIVNILKDELPAKGPQHFGWFLVGTLVYTLLVML